MTSKRPESDQLPVAVADDEWVDVPKGMTPALGVVPHPDQERYPGVLVMENDYSSVVRWHNKGCTRTGTLDPAKVRFDRNGAPWCPTCFAENEHRDPTWNQDPAVTLTPTPANAGGPGKTRTRHELNREAIARGKFRDPSHRGLATGDDKRPVVGDLGKLLGKSED